MINILQTEFFRLKKSKLFWALFGVCAGLPVLSLLLELVVLASASMAFDEMSGYIWELFRQSNLTASSLSALTTWGSNPALFSIICSSIVLSKEFSGGTVRNMLLANKSRQQLYWAYSIVALVIGASYFVASFVAVLLLQGSVFGFGSMTAGEAVTACFSSFALGALSTVAVQACVCMLLFASRKTGATLACSLVICLFAPSIVYTIVQVTEIVRILWDAPMTSEAVLGWIPLYNMQLFDASNVDGALIGKIALYQVLITAFFGGMGWLGIRKTDLK